jgi:hypothetical protein
MRDGTRRRSADAYAIECLARGISGRKLGHPTPPILNFAQAAVQTAPNLSTPEAHLPVSRPDSAPVCGPKRRGRSPLKDSDLIEIALPNGMVVRVGADVDQAALGRVLR